MKKLNLQLGSIKEMLTKEEMKKITGGYSTGGGGGGWGASHGTIVCSGINFKYVCTSSPDPGGCTTECMAASIDCVGCYFVVCHGRGNHLCG